MQTSVLALPRISALTSVSRQRKARASYLQAFCLVVAWLLLLLTTLCCEMAVVFAIGTGVRVVFVDSSAHQYDTARFGQ